SPYKAFKTSDQMFQAQPRLALPSSTLQTTKAGDSNFLYGLAQPQLSTAGLSLAPQVVTMQDFSQQQPPHLHPLNSSKSGRDNPALPALLFRDNPEQVSYPPSGGGYGLGGGGNRGGGNGGGRGGGPSWGGGQGGNGPPENSLPMGRGPPDEPPPDPPIAAGQIPQDPRGLPGPQPYNPLQPRL